MNLRQLEYLVAVVEDGSITRAAQRLYVSQPSLSQQIRALEAEVGGELIERLPRGVRATTAGEAFVASARAALGATARARQAARAVLGLQTGELSVAATPSIAFGVLPEALRSWREQFPGIAVRAREYGRRQSLEEAVRSASADLGIGSVPAGWSGPVQRLGVEELVLVLPRGDRLAGCTDPLAVGQLADRSWILLDADDELAELTRGVCAAAGFGPRAALHAAHQASVPLLAATGGGVALVPRTVVPRDLDASVRPLDPPLGREVAAFTRRSWSPEAAAFLSVLAARPWPQPVDELERAA